MYILNTDCHLQQCTVIIFYLCNQQRIKFKRTFTVEFSLPTNVSKLNGLKSFGFRLTELHAPLAFYAFTYMLRSFGIDNEQVESRIKITSYIFICYLLNHNQSCLWENLILTTTDVLLIYRYISFITL